MLEWARLDDVELAQQLIDAAKRAEKPQTAPLTSDEVKALTPEDDKLLAILKARYPSNMTPGSFTPGIVKKVDVKKYFKRALHKLKWFMKSGHSLTSENLAIPSSIGFFSEVTNHELAMSDAAFNESWSDEAAMTRKRIRIEKGLIPDAMGNLLVKKAKKQKLKKLVCQKCDKAFKARRRNTKLCSDCGGPADPTKRYCTLGTKCFRGEKGKPALCETTSPYCGKVCLASFKASVKRLMRESAA